MKKGFPIGIYALLLVGALSLSLFVFQYTYIGDSADMLYEEADIELADMGEAKEIKRIFVHCTATTADWSKERLMKFFKESRGWSKPGYHYYIRRNGQIDTLVYLNSDNKISWNEIAYGAAGYNGTSIHVAYAGGVDWRGRPADTRTIYQKASISTVINILRMQYGELPVFGHHRVAKKACPSFNVMNEYDYPNFADTLIIFDKDLHNN